ncbi:hypothetical protein LIER_04756 [Lithospermum erythrorhizon]|uniref:Uncharacterized protein n=1 Tax=Lithospermum erythrorhizon TaxID=34254 RepID=A0AAV3NZ47_LITER
MPLLLSSTILLFLLVYTFREGELRLINQVLMALIPCETPLHIAAKNGLLRLSTAFIRCAKKSGSEASKALLRITDGNGDLKMVRLLVDEDQRYYKHFPKSMGETPLLIALEKGNDDMLELVSGTSSLDRYKGPKGETVLHIAVRRQLEKSLNWIIEKNSKLANQVDTSGWTPLHYAAFSGFIYAAEVLLDIDESLGYVKGGNREDLTALHIASSKGDIVLMHLILEHCPDSWDMLTSRKQNILHLVAGYGLSGAAIKWVLDKPWVANLINEKDEEGNTPIQLYFQVVSSSEDDGKSLVLTHPQVLKVLSMESFDEKESKQQLKNARRMLSNGWKDHADWLTKNV